MRQFKNLFPLIASIGVFFLAGNSPMWEQMNESPSDENLSKFIPEKNLNNSSKNGFNLL